jgi:predicted GH43/DUF377 family glycosyl hydrolase
LSASSLGVDRPLEGQDDAEARGVVAEGEAGAAELGHRRDQAQAETAAGRDTAPIASLRNFSESARKLRYSAAVLVLSEKHPRSIRYRSPVPVLTPELRQERQGMVANVVFPTAIDRRDDLGSPDRFDVYYGMADNRVGVARLDLPECLPPGAADPPVTKV